MALDEGDKAIVREIAWEVSNTIVNRIEKRLDEQLEAHQLTCPAANAVKRTKVFLVGVGIGAALVGSGGMFAALKILKLF